MTPPRTSRRRGLAVAAIALAATLAACADDGPHARPQTDAVEPNGVVVDVISIDNTFQPNRVEITPGTEVRWTNRGRTAHDILPFVGTDWGVAKGDLPPGASYSHVFTDVGEVTYYCSIHASANHPAFGMTGTIVVAEA